MDAFAENQMGRGDDMPSPEHHQRKRKPTKERAMVEPADTEDAQDLLASQEARPDDEPTDVPVMSLDESVLIAARWERKRAAFMPVGDPYAEPDTSKPRAQQLAAHYCACSTIGATAKGAMITLFPVITWLPKINWASLRADVTAGLTVGVMLIPQSMSYANIAGLEYKYGLYTSVLPVITYALMGTSRQLGVGPVAMVSLLVEVGLKGALTETECPAYFAQEDVPGLAKADWELQSELCPDAYAELAFLTSFLVGIFQLGAGFLRLGFLVSFLAHPVISGFTSAAAIIIGLSQLQYFVGYKIPKSQYVNETIQHIVTTLDQTKYEQLLLGLTWWFMLSMSRRLSIKYKKRFGWLKAMAPLITCLLAIVIGANLDIFNGCGFTKCQSNFTDDDEKKEVEKYIVGTIPSGLSSMGSLDKLDLGRISSIFSTAVLCAAIGFMESIAIAKSLAAKHKYEIDASQELVALGVANLLGSFTSAYPVTGSFSRSAVNNQVGAQSQLAGLLTGLLLLITIVGLTPLFYFLPKYALAAIVISSVTNLVDYKEAQHLWKIKKQDFLLWVVAFLGTLFTGVMWGLVLSVGCSLALVIIESIRPQMSVLWRLPNTPIWRNIKQESSGQFVPGVMVVRIGASMYFANVAFIRDFVQKMVGEFSEAADTAVAAPTRTTNAATAKGGDKQEKWVTAEPIRFIVMEMTPVVSIDSTALHMLEDLHRDLKERGIRLAFATVGNRVEETLERSGLLDKMGKQWIFPSVHSAVQHCIRQRMRTDAHIDAVGEGAEETLDDATVVSATKVGTAKRSLSGVVEMASVEVEEARK